MVTAMRKRAPHVRPTGIPVLELPPEILQKCEETDPNPAAKVPLWVLLCGSSELLLATGIAVFVILYMLG